MQVNRTEIAAQYGLPTDVPIVLTAGRVIPRKGHSTILEALCLLSRPVHWLVVGEDKGEVHVIKERASVLRKTDSVTFVGALPQTELSRLYNACDIFVSMPFEIAHEETVETEGFGLVLYEAAACGRPVITSDVAGCREAVVNKKTGLLVKPGDPQQLALAIESLLSDEISRARMSRAAKAHVHEIGSWHQYVLGLMKLYRTA
jgi:phosphatidylinositol alpha-1,6-mannosyltransferase